MYYSLPIKQRRSLLHYLAHQGESADYPWFIELMTQTPYREDVMTLAQYLKQQGLEEGLQEGLQQGREKGQEKGRQQGKKEAALTIARNMLAKGVELTFIQEVTQLTDEEIIALMPKH